jgi:hypothetical protein
LSALEQPGHAEIPSPEVAVVFLDWAVGPRSGTPATTELVDIVLHNPTRPDLHGIYSLHLPPPSLL